MLTPVVPDQPLLQAVNETQNVVIIDTRSLDAPKEVAVLLADRSVVVVSKRSKDVFIVRPSGAVVNLTLLPTNATSSMQRMQRMRWQNK